MRARRKPVLLFGILVVVTAVVAFVGFTPLTARAATAELNALATRAANFLYNEFVKNGAQNSEFGVGSYAAYMLTRAGVDVGAWVRDGTSLKDTVIEMIYQDVGASQQASAKLLAQDLLAAQALQRADLAQAICQALKGKENPGGFDSGGYAIFSNVAAYEFLGRAGCLNQFVYARDYLLSTQNMAYASTPDAVYESVYGSWGGAWGPDFMTTAQAVRALRYLNPQDEEVQQRMNLGLAWLKKQQQRDGSFVASDWDDPLVNTVEMVATLLAVGEDPSSVMIDGGKSPVDYLREKALNPDGSFGRYKNVMDATWALYGYHLLGAQVSPAVLLTPSGAAIKVGESARFTAVMYDACAIDRDITQDAIWSVQDAGVASVAYGLVTGLKTGSTVITATYDGLTGSATITVVPAGGGSGGGDRTTCTVGVAVVGMNGELLFGPSYVQLLEGGQWGLTALGALDATGLPYRVSQQWEGFVEEIAGQANQGLSGWCYAVNGVLPSSSADKYLVKDGDKVIWFYSKDFSSPVPKWEDLVKQKTTGTPPEAATPAAEALKRVENTLSDLQSGKVSAGQVVSRLTETLEKLKEAEVTTELKDKLSEAARLLAVALAKVPDKALTFQEGGERASLIVDGEILKDQVGALKNAAGLAEKLQKIGVAAAAALVKDELVVEVPGAFAGKSDLSAVFPAGAGREAAAAGLAFVLREREVSLRLPPAALKAVVDAAPNVAQVEVSVRKVDGAKAGLFEGASLVTESAFDLEVCGLTPEGKSEKPTAFPERLAIALSLEGVDLDKLDLGKVAVYRKKENGAWEFVGGQLSADGKSFTCETDRLSLYALAEFRKTFKDTEGHWAREAIDLLARRLIVRGVASDLFAPDEKVTRAQFAALLVRALGREEEPAARPVFKDVPSGHWGRGAVEAAFQAELVLGTGNGMFEPERWITREEMAAMLARVLEKQGAVVVKPDASQVAEALAGYADNGAVSPWAREGVAACVKSGLIKGRSASELAPKGTTTRAEAAVVITNLLQLLARV